MKKLEDLLTRRAENFMKFEKFKLFGRDFAFTKINDDITWYSFGTEHWQRIGFGFYKPRNSLNK